MMLYVLFMCKCVLPPGVNPIAADKYININNNYHHISVAQESLSVMTQNPTYVLMAPYLCRTYCYLLRETIFSDY
jgi:hypothetical protein